MKLGIIIVSYNVRDLLVACLESALRDAANTPGVQTRIIVVDNASADGSAARVAADFPQIELIASTENLGFAGGNNRALRALGFDANPPRPTRPDAVLLLNPDTEIQPGALATLTDFLRANPRAGGCCPRLNYGDGSFQHSAFHFPGLAQLFLDLHPIHPRLLDTRLNGRYPRRLYDGDRPFAVDFALGAAVMVRADAIADAGLLDEGYFMYAEEMDWQRRIQAAGWPIYCVPHARVTHHEGRSTRQARSAMTTALWRSRFRYYDKYYPAWKRRAARTLVRGAVRREQLAESESQIASGNPKLATRNSELGPPNTLACAILARNAAADIGDCVRSCAFADRVMVFIDTQSSDNTAEIAAKAGAVVIDTPFVNFSQARNFALEYLDSDWVFFVDVDERVTPELAQEAREVIQREDVAGWWVPRHNHIVGHVMAGGGWYPDYQLRLMRRTQAHYDPARAVHELAIIAGAEGKLSQHLIHYNYRSWAQFHEKQRRYTAFEAQTLRREGVRAHPRHLITRPVQAFWRRFYNWQGYRDGVMGLRLSVLMAWYEALKYWWLLRG